jgi:hypothetical protein
MDSEAKRSEERKITIRIPEEIAQKKEAQAKAMGKTLTEFACETLIAAWVAPDATNANDLNLRGRLDELINQVIRIRMSLFGIAQYAQGGAFISKSWLESINAQCRELAPKTNYRTP